jgi:NAD(P)-dependent dehydrogenase (short-subunit alcohol dehydrogenase family)
MLVTGANRGIGLSLARYALRHDWRVVATARPTSNNDALLALRDSNPARLTIESLDVASEPSIEALAGRVASTPIDVLVNNAGVIGPDRQSTLDMDFTGFEQTLIVNTLGPLRVTQALLPALRLARDASGIAKVVAITSAMGRMSYAKSDKIAYRASKAAANKIMQGLATDLLAENVSVLLIHPGWVRTDMGGSLADIDVDESAKGIFQRIDAMNMQQSGTFVDYKGEVVPW